jgi:hypothetical protein
MSLRLQRVLSCGASKFNTETGSPVRPTIIVEKLTVKLDAQQLTTNSVAQIVSGNGRVWALIQKF